MCTERGPGGLLRAMAALKVEPEVSASSGEGDCSGDRGRRHSMSKNIISVNEGNTTIISTQKLIMNRHVIYSFIKRRQTSNQRGSRLAILLMNLPHFWVKCDSHRWNAELRNVLPAQEATLPALIKRRQQLPLAVGDVGNQTGELKVILTRQAGLDSPKPRDSVSLLERLHLALGLQGICNTRNGQDASGNEGDFRTSDLFDDTLVRFINSFDFFPISSLKL